MDNNKPTQRQIDYAEDIAKALEFDLPISFTKKTYCEFISKHLDDYKIYMDLRS